MSNSSSIIKLTGFEAEAEVLGHQRHVLFSEANLTISGLTLAEAHDVLKVLATGSLQRIEGDPLSFSMDDGPPPGRSSASRQEAPPPGTSASTPPRRRRRRKAKEVETVDGEVAPGVDPEFVEPTDGELEKGWADAVATDRDPEPVAATPDVEDGDDEPPPRRRRSAKNPEKVAAAPPPFKTRERSGAAADPHPVEAPVRDSKGGPPEEGPEEGDEPETAAQAEPARAGGDSGANGLNGKVGGTPYPKLEADADPWGLAPEGAVHEDLLTAPTLKDVMNTMVDLGMHDAAEIEKACVHFKERIPALSRVGNLKTRVARRLLKMDLG